MLRFRHVVIALVTLDFTAFTLWALAEGGVTGWIAPFLDTPMFMQTGIDLAIALTLFVTWMWRDARSRGLNPWAWALLTCCTGSIGALVYVVRRDFAPVQAELRPDAAVRGTMAA